MEKLREWAEEFGIVLTQQQIAQFVEYYEQLIEKNKVMNLTAITQKDDVMQKHFLDSLSLGRVVSLGEHGKGTICLPKDCSILDMGTGAGFPGIPLKIAFSGTKVVLADSLKKRVVFLQEVIDSLGLTNVTAVHGRAEELARQEEYREQFSLCVSRAVANLSVLAEYCLPFVKVGGYFIAYKSLHIEEEAEESKKAISVLGGKLIQQAEFFLPQSDIGRNLIVVQKIKPTGKKYPRNAGKPSKEPIH